MWVQSQSSSVKLVSLITVLAVASQKVFPSKIDVVTWYCRVHRMTNTNGVSVILWGKVRAWKFRLCLYEEASFDHYSTIRIVIFMIQNLPMKSVPDADFRRCYPHPQAAIHF
jgi:hypothetical protein